MIFVAKTASDLTMHLGRLLASVIVLWASASAAQESPPQGGPPSRPAPEAEARQTYDRGRTQYDLGEYPAAISLFSRAYELSSAPALLFDIAQAYRLSGDCAKALEEYRHFVRLDPESQRRADADAYIASLGVECGARPPVPVGASEPVRVALDSAGATPRITEAARSDDHRSRSVTATRLGWTLLGAGLALGAGAGGLALWNDGRYSTWAKEDHALATAPADPAQRTSWVAHQNANDNLLSSIHGVDRATVVMAGTSMACIAAAAVIALVKLERAPEVAP
jgi:tetratricopeptide (TPR) repeat protein